MDIGFIGLGAMGSHIVETLIRAGYKPRVTAPSYKIYGEAIAKRRYEPPAFRLSLLLKDVRLALSAADAAGAPMPLANVVHDALLEAFEHGDGDRDLAVLATVSMRRAGAKEPSNAGPSNA